MRLVNESQISNHLEYPNMNLIWYGNKNITTICSTRNVTVTPSGDSKGGGSTDSSLSCTKGWRKKKREHLLTCTKRSSATPLALTTGCWKGEQCQYIGYHVPEDVCAWSNLEILILKRTCWKKALIICLKNNILGVAMTKTLLTCVCAHHGLPVHGWPLVQKHASLLWAHQCGGWARPPSPGQSACAWNCLGGRRRPRSIRWWRHWGWAGG